MKTTDSLRHIGRGDQRLPCSLRTPERNCSTRATFIIRPLGSHTEEEWPYTQSCLTHLGRVVRLASARCNHGHCRGAVVVSEL